MTTTWTTLVEAEALAAALDRDDLVVIDCRFSLAAPDAGEAAYGVVAHSRCVVRAPGSRPVRPSQAGRGPPSLARCGGLQRNGLATGAFPHEHQVVAYDDGDGAHAARLWFLLRALGHERVAVLDGGWARWTALGLPTQTIVRDVSHVPRSGELR